MERTPVLLVSANYFPKIGGPATSVPEIARCLSKHGYPVHVLTNQFPGFAAVEHSEGFTVWRSPSSYRIPNKASVVEHGLSVIEMAKFIRSFVRTHPFRFIHCHDLNISLLGAWLAGTGLPIIAKYTGDLSIEQQFADVDSVERFERRFNPLRPSWPTRFFKLGQRGLSEMATLITANSKYQLDQLHGLGVSPKKSVLLYNGVSTRSFNVPSGVTITPYRILFFGRLVAWKGIHVLIQAFNRIAGQFPTAELLIVGNGPMERELKAISEKTPHGKRIIFQKAVAPHTVPIQIAGAQVVVLPAFYDPFPHSVLETLALVRPMVATRVGGIPEIIEDGKTGWLVEPGDASALAKAIVDVFQNPAEAERRAVEGARRVRDRFTWEILVNELEQLYTRFD